MSGLTNPKIESLCEQLFSTLLLAQSEEGKLPERFLQQQLPFSREISHHFCKRGTITGKGYGPYLELQGGQLIIDLTGEQRGTLLGHAHPILLKASVEATTFSATDHSSHLIHPLFHDTANRILQSVSGSHLSHFTYTPHMLGAHHKVLALLAGHSPERTHLLVLNNRSFRPFIGNDRLHLIGPVDFKLSPEAILQQLQHEISELEESDIERIGALYLNLVEGAQGFGEYPQIVVDWLTQWAHKHQIFVWINEGVSFGRTSRLYSFQHYHLEAVVDLVTLGGELQIFGVLHSHKLKTEREDSSHLHIPFAHLLYANALIPLLADTPFYGSLGKIAKLSHEMQLQSHDLNKFQNCHYLGGIGTLWSFDFDHKNSEQTEALLQRAFSSYLLLSHSSNQSCSLDMRLPLTLSVDELKLVLERFASC